MSEFVNINQTPNMSPIIYKMGKCPNCGKDVQERYINLHGERKQIGNKLCLDCHKLVVEKLTQGKLDTKLQKEIFDKQRQEWGRLRLPQMYWDKTFANFITKNSVKEIAGNLNKVLKSCVKYANEYLIEYNKWLKENKKPYPSIILYSGVGQGKTHLVCAIGHRIINRWNGEKVACPIYFVSEGDIYRRIIATYSYSQEERMNKPSEDDIINYLIKVPLLILDDLGKEARSDLKFIQRIMFNIVDGRYKAMLPMIITTNMAPSELQLYIGSEAESACCSRLYEMSKEYQWQINAEDYRIKENA